MVAHQRLVAVRCVIRAVEFPLQFVAETARVLKQIIYFLVGAIAEIGLFREVISRENYSLIPAFAFVTAFCCITLYRITRV